MAQEVNLNSLQDSDREVILQVLYRDQAVQNAEEERIRYAPWDGCGPWGSGLFCGEPAPPSVARGPVLTPRPPVCPGPRDGRRVAATVSSSPSKTGRDAEAAFAIRLKLCLSRGKFASCAGLTLGKLPGL